MTHGKSPDLKRWLTSMFRTWPLVAIALAALLILIAASNLATRRKAQQINTQLDEMHMLHRHIEGQLRKVRSDVHLSGIFIRDYLLDNSQLTGPSYRARLIDLRKSTTATLEDLEPLVDPKVVDRIVSLQEKLEDYWGAFGPLFEWDQSQKTALSSSFLRRQVLPRRDAVLNIAEVIEDLNNANLKEQRAAIAIQEYELHRFLTQTLWVSLCLGIGVAVAAVLRIRVLERRSEEQHERSEEAESEMRRLSQQLVTAQEEERKRLSRELHDEVGQALTALRMEIARAERLCPTSGTTLSAQLAECKHLIETLIHTVRNLSMGLRPSMLDDFGLGTALKWHAQDFTRRYQVMVNVALEGDLDRLPEPHRTCVYRVVQEALTNCARHANATQVGVSLRREAAALRLLIHDDGVGLQDQARNRDGLGLLGIEERVKELQGFLSIHSTNGAGTTLCVEIPVPETVVEEDQLATRSSG
jgi:signal transduction histidine kinase